jgi:PsbP-like protein
LIKWINSYSIVIISLIVIIAITAVINPVHAAILGLPNDLFEGEEANDTNANTTTTDRASNTTTNMTQPVRSFLTYKDQASLFTINYPSDWKIITPKAGHVTFMSPSDFDSSRHIATLIVSAADTNMTTLNQLNSQIKSRLSIVGAKIDNESQSTLSGLPAHKIVADSKLSSKSAKFNGVEIFTLKNDKEYKISYNIGQTDGFRTIQRMVDSFQIKK